MAELTAEQKAVVVHPRGKHARVLAVAGSGKTTTMVERVKYLVETAHVSPDDICILMFNKNARVDFQKKIDEALPGGRRPQVHTFHSYAYTLIAQATREGILPHMEMWVGGEEELVRLTLHRAINNLVKFDKKIDKESIDIDEVMEAIALWKGALIPPERAGHRVNPVFVRAYKEFESLRLEQRGITFDDFVPDAIQLLQNAPSIIKGAINKFQFVIVDEYQDVNYGQQRLVELLAGKHADIMVVGDDDQTIYEWRGARPDYIVREFERTFSNKPVIDYRLSQTFRFGPIVAQAAQNLISRNAPRHAKSVIAHQHTKQTSIHLVYGTASESATKELVSQLIAAVKLTQNPQSVVVLARLYSQLAELEIELSIRGVPYFVEGREVFFRRREIVALLDYVRLAEALDQPATNEHLNTLFSVLNVPNRGIPRELVTQCFRAQPRLTMRELLREAQTDSGLDPIRTSRFQDFITVVEQTNRRWTTTPAGELLNWLVKRLDYLSHFDNYYGKGVNSEDRKGLVAFFCDLAVQTNTSFTNFIHFLESLDTGRGESEDQQIRLTTVFRVKGEEFDYVFIPECINGFMPYLPSTGSATELIYDVQQPSKKVTPSDLGDSERRLFYVAITRAKETVFIGTQKNSPSEFIAEMRLEATQEIMAAYWQAQSGTVDAQKNLNAVVRRHGQHKLITNNLINHYLPMGNLKLDAETEQAIQQMPEDVHPISPKPETKATPKPPDTPQKQKRPWWEENR